MSSENHLSSREAFVIRLWKVDEDQRGWRGQIQHVRTGSITHIQEIDDLKKYFKEYIEDEEAEKAGLK
ncbi:MAG: hypothetical protein HN390_07000 [Anaerolineae bacterium]|nr:hypothetical protein [Anaerolineae bacterium]MBT7189784.1 hypothetical protein [Anaerolineae bacterium]MBT7991009.1 hypothetical protein [Anaerolineae bacterium]